MQGKIIGMPANDVEGEEQKVSYSCKITLQIGTHPIIYGRDAQSGRLIPGVKQLGEAAEYNSAQFLGQHEAGKSFAATIGLAKLIDFLNKVCETPVVIVGEDDQNQKMQLEEEGQDAS